MASFIWNLEASEREMVEYICTFHRINEEMDSTFHQKIEEEIDLIK